MCSEMKAARRVKRQQRSIKPATQEQRTLEAFKASLQRVIHHDAVEKARHVALGHLGARVRQANLNLRITATTRQPLVL